MPRVLIGWLLILAPLVSYSQSDSSKEKLATLINLNGQLCAKVVNVSKVGNAVYEVECIRYRDGAGRATYMVDLSTGRVK